MSFYYPSKEVDLKIALLRSLGDMGDHEIADPIVRSLLSKEFNSFEDVAADAQTFALLGEAAPEIVLTVLNRLMRDVSLERLRDFKEGRRNIVPMLDNLLRLENTFWIAAQLLTRLAAAENETYVNNATGIWKSIFLIRLGGSPISALDRLQLVGELLEHQDIEMRLVAIDALESSLSNIEYARAISGPRGYISPQPWYPETWKEFWDVRRAALQLLDTALEDDIEVVVAKASKCLLESASHQILVLTDEILSRFDRLPKTDFYKVEVWKTLQTILKFEEKRLEDEQKQQIEKLAQAVITDSYHDQLLIYVKDVDFSIHRGFETVQEFQQFLDGKIEALVRQGYENPALLKTELDWLTALQPTFFSQIRSFMRGLGRLDNNHSWLSVLMDYSAQNENRSIVEAYLLGRIDVQELVWVRQQLVDWAENEVGMAPVVLFVMSLIDVSDDGVALIEKLLNKGWLQAKDVGLQRQWTENISLQGARSLLSRLLSDPSPEAAYSGIYCAYSRLEKHQDEVGELTDYIVSLMKRSPGERINQGMFSWQWEQLAYFYVDTYPVEIADAAFTVFRLGDLGFYLHDEDSIWAIVREAFRRAPEAVWSKIDERMQLPEDQPEHISPYCLRNLQISSQETAKILLKWANENQPDGPEIVAEMAFVGGKSLNYLVERLLIEFPENERVRGVLGSNFVNVGIYDPSEYSKLLQDLRNLALEWLHSAPPTIRRWVQEVIDELDEMIAKNRTRAS